MVLAEVRCVDTGILDIFSASALIEAGLTDIGTSGALSTTKSLELLPRINVSTDSKGTIECECESTDKSGTSKAGSIVNADERTSLSRRGSSGLENAAEFSLGCGRSVVDEGP